MYTETTDVVDECPGMKKSLAMRQLFVDPRCDVMLDSGLTNQILDLTEHVIGTSNQMASLT